MADGGVVDMGIAEIVPYNYNYTRIYGGISTRLL